MDKYSPVNQITRICNKIRQNRKTISYKFGMVTKKCIKTYMQKYQGETFSVINCM